MDRGVRPALAAGQKAALLPADADRIEQAGQSAESALAAVLDASLFDTEPAHFERFLTRSARGATA